MALAVNVRAIVELLGLLALANYTPILMKKLAGRRWAWPVDGGWKFFDGQPLFGTSKTVRGVVASVVVTSAASWAVGLGWKLGAVIAACSMGGDLFSSFCKRRLRLTAGSRATGLDQIPEVLFPALAVRGAMGFSVLDITVAGVIFVVGEMLMSVLFYRWHLRDRPY